MNQKNLSTGVLLINLGTPNSPTPKDVRHYLKEFLSDKRVLNVFWILRWFLLYFIILPFRSKRSAKLYQKIWTREGSPLFVYSEQCRNALARQLGENYIVNLAMRYGKPSIEENIKNLTKNNIEHLIIVPMFPQYAAGITGSIIEKTSQCLNNNWHIPTYSIVKPFFQNHYFVQAFKELILENLHTVKPDFVLFSYHGLPLKHLKKSLDSVVKPRNDTVKPRNDTCLSHSNCCETYCQDNSFCYRAQCFETTRLIANACNLKQNHFTTAFQSRFGNDEWTLPNTQTILKELYQTGVRTLSVACPGFVTDCLETLEEIEIRLKEQWLALGGCDLVLIKSLNDNHTWILGLEEMIRGHNNH